MARWNKTPAEKVELTKTLFETTAMTYQEIADELGISFHQVLNVVHRSYSAEVIRERKRKNYQKSKLGDLNPMKGVVRTKHHNYVGEVSDGRGYLMILKPEWYTGRKNSNHVFVHHVVICEHMNLTQIPAGYSVHHCDKNPLNNDFSNLVLISNGAHSALHQWLIREGATTISKESTLKWVEAHGKGIKVSLDDIV